MRYGKACLLVGVLFGMAVANAADRAALPEPLVLPNVVKTQPTELPRPTGLTLDVETYPRTNGSTSAEPLGVWVACSLLGEQCRWPEGYYGAERRLMPWQADPDGVVRWRRADLYRKIGHEGTHGAYESLIAGLADLIYECRLPSRDESELMQVAGVELEATPIARDAFVFLVHKDGPAAGLTAEQARDIYTRGEDGKGRIANWQDVGGPDAEIHAYVRNRNSGSQETMQSLVMKDREIVGGRAMTGMTMRGPYNHLEQDKHGIGFTFLYYQRYMSPVGPARSKRSQQAEPAAPQEPSVRMLAIDGVMPSRETIADGTYPWVTDVYAVTRKDLAPDHPAAKLKAWLLTDEGQAVIAETGYVPLRRADAEAGQEAAPAPR